MFVKLLRTVALASVMLAPLPALAQQAAPSGAPQDLAVATFAGGCFWCMEPPYDKLDGIVSTVSGYMGGKTPNPTYKQVTAGGTGHAEVLQVTYDPKKVNYQKLLDVFWRNIDPYDKNGQFCDKGDSYRSGIFYHNDEQKTLAEASKANIQKTGPLSKPVATEVTAASTFTKAEEYHQDYYQKNPIQYYFYRNGCGRDAKLDQLWGKSATQ